MEQPGIRTGGEDRLVPSRKGMRGVQSGWNKEWKVVLPRTAEPEREAAARALRAL